MDFRIFICAVLCSFPFCSDGGTVRKARSSSLHFPPIEAPTFLRDAVERRPQWLGAGLDRSAAYSTQPEFGSRSLPLRSAVESIPDVKATSRRLPLRDAVEKRPPPDEAFDLDIDLDYLNYQPDFKQNILPIFKQYSNPNAFVPQRSAYTPLNYFQSIAGFPAIPVSDIRNIPLYNPYTIPQSSNIPLRSNYQSPLVGPYSHNIPTPNHNFVQDITNLRNVPTFKRPVSHYNKRPVNKHAEVLRNVPPRYTVDSVYQQLVQRPDPFPRGRSLFSQNSYQRLSQGNKNLAAKYQTLNRRTEANKGPDYRIVCYMQSAAAYRKDPMAFNAKEMDPFACTHLIYAFATIDPHNYHISAYDEEHDLVQGGYKSVAGMKRINPALKVLVSVGGGREEGSHRFSSMVASSARRRGFIRSTVTFLRMHNFDGLDLHWQYPGAEEFGGHLNDKENLELFLEEISEVFKQEGWLLSIAVPASRFRIEDGFNPQQLSRTVDFINLQAFDFHTEREPAADHHAPLNTREHDSGLDIFFNTDYAVRYWLKKGVPKSMITLGIPFYGRSFTLEFPNSTALGSKIRGPGREGFYTQTPGFLAYFEICDAILNEGWHRGADDASGSYIYNGDQWVGFDDVDSVERKIQYIKELGLGGASVWSADLDDFKGLCGEKWPLLNTVKLLLKNDNVENANANGAETSAIKPYGSCTADGMFSDPNNCGAYLVCRTGISYQIKCQPHMMFDAESGQCRHMEVSRCLPGKSIYVHNGADIIDHILKTERLVDTKPKVVCYLTNWAFYRKGDGKFVPEHLHQQLCTHVVYAFASLDPDDLIAKEFDPWADLDNNLYQRVTALKDTKVLLALGGWTDSSGDKYSRLVSDGSARRKFVVSTVAFLRKHGFRGLHVDWNYPTCWQSNCKKGPAADKPNFTKLLQELRKEFNKQSPPMILAAAISGYKEVIDVAYELPALGEVLDFMSVMTYDYHGNWERRTGHVSPLYHRPGDKYEQYNTNYTMEYLVQMGAPRQKLLMGVPFYGQSFTLSKQDGRFDQGVPTSGPGDAGEYTKQPGMLAYYEICNRIRNQRWIVSRDNLKATGPHAYSKDQWVSYEDIQSVKEKAEYIKMSGFGGAVAWTVDLDDFGNHCCQESFPLLRTLNRGLGLASDVMTAMGDCTKPPTPVTPPPPALTTGVDTGASNSPTTEQTWRPTKPSSTASTTTSPWWTPETTPSTTTHGSTTTSPWWLPTTPSPTTHGPWDHPTTSSTPAPWEQPWTSTTSSTPPSWEQPSTTAATTTTTTTTMRPTTQQPTWGDPGTTIPPPAVVMPEIDKPAGTCEPGSYISDKNNCNSYYRCILGELKKQYCAGGLHWNNQIKICDWPNNAKCEDRSAMLITKPHEEMTTPQQQWSEWTPSSTTTTTTQRTTTTSTTTTENPHYEPIAPVKNCVNGQYYPHELCNSFYVCVNNDLVTQHCASGLHWNTENGNCDWGYKSKCVDRVKFSEPIKALGAGAAVPYSPCDSGTFAAYPNDCNKYLSCLWGKYETFECSSGLHWNVKQKICDWPQNAHCTQESTGDVGQIDSADEPAATSKPIYNPTKPTTQPIYVPDVNATTETSRPVQSPAQPLSGYFKVVCYFTNWAWYRRGVGKYVPEDIDPNLCTHIVYGFAVLDYENLVVKAHDSWADFDNKFYERVVAYKAKGLKVSLALGGWNDSQGDKYSRLVNNPAARARFIKHVMEFLEKYNFDGLDLDWEYPKCWQVDCNKGPDSDKPAFAAWIRELHAAFKPKGYLLSAAVSPSKTVIDAGYDVPALAEALDWVAVMTYDYHGQWDKQTGHVAPMYVHPDDEVVFFNTNYTINYWISEGVPRRKIVMGMPLYGQSFQLERESDHGLNAKAPGPGQAGEFTRAAGFLAYYEICDKVKNEGWTVVQDKKRRLGPYAYKGNQWVSYDDKAMIRLKSEYIRQMDLGGGMIWALDLDDFKNRCGEGHHPLLTAIADVLRAPGTGKPEPILGMNEPEVSQPEQPIHVPDVDTSYPSPPVDQPPPPPPPSTVDESTFRPTTPSTTVSSLQPAGSSQFKVVCYFTNWAWYRQSGGKYLPSDIDPDLCTHIVYGFAVLNGDQMVIKPHDPWADFDNKFYEKVTALKAKGIKVLIAIGGWNDSAGDKYSKLVNNPSARRRFITHVMDFIETNNFDGLDLDWEYPKCWQVDCNKGPDSDKAAFSAWVKELHDAFKPKGWLLSAAVSPSKRVVDSGYDVPALSQYLDWIAVMAYDYHGQWDKITGHVAPMYVHPEDVDVTFNTNFTIHYWIDQGADRRKIVLGMPMYGQSFSLADNQNNGLNAPTYGGGEAGDATRARGFLAYYEICSNIQKRAWKVVRDPKGRIGPYAYLRDQWVSFDDKAMIEHKSEFIKAMGLGGGMIWALDLDDFKNDCGCEKYPLLKTINRVLRDYPGPSPDCKLDDQSRLDEKPVKKPAEVTTVAPWLNNNDVEVLQNELLPCSGILFQEDKNNCHQYYLCNQGQLMTQVCPSGLYWNKDHCDWPENTDCESKGTTAMTTVKPVTQPPATVDESKPTYPGTSSDYIPASDSRYKVVCYFTNWAWYRQGDGKYTPNDIESNLCTHITYGFAVLDPNTLTIKPHDSWADIDNEFYHKVTAQQAKGIKVLIALGGWNDSLGDKYSRLVNDAAARARFVEHVTQFIQKWGFDGLDLDWEYPKCWQVDCSKGPDSDKEGFAALVRELSAVFRPKGWLLSSAVSPSKAVIDAGYDVPTLSKYFDWIAVMTYDFHGHWDKQTGHVAPLYHYPGDTYDYFNANFSLNYWIEKGAAPEKLVMGMPLYGQSFSLADATKNGLNAKSYGPGEAGEFTRAGGFLAFYEICERIKQRSWKVVRDPEGRIGPYAYMGSQWVSYDDISDIRRKSKLVKQLGLGGGMIWALDLDDFRNRCGCGKHPLLKTMNNELRNIPTDIQLNDCT